LCEVSVTLGEIRRRNPEVIEAATRHVVDHSIGLLVIDGPNVRPGYLGSGTLVERGKVRGILTAQHVATAFPVGGTVGFGFREHVHALKVTSDRLDVQVIATPRAPASGPDLAFVRLPPPEEATIASVKSFVNLSRGEERVAALGPETDRGVWCLAGCAAEQVVPEPAIAGFEEVLGCYGEIGWTGIDRRFEDESGFDYLELSVDYNGDDRHPQDFEGYSGGGIWYNPVRESAEHQFVAAKPLFAGLAFYQGSVTAGRRHIRCHGPRSVYLAAGPAIDAKYGKR
jgi:hypothetical protein